MTYSLGMKLQAHFWLYAHMHEQSVYFIWEMHVLQNSEDSYWDF